MSAEKRGLKFWSVCMDAWHASANGQVQGRLPCFPVKGAAAAMAHAAPGSVYRATIMGPGTCAAVARLQGSWCGMLACAVPAGARALAKHNLTVKGPRGIGQCGLRVHVSDSVSCWGVCLLLKGHPVLTVCAPSGVAVVAACLAPLQPPTGRSLRCGCFLRP